MSDPEFTRKFSCMHCPAAQRMPTLALPEGWVELEMTIGTGDYSCHHVKKLLCPACVKHESRLVTTALPPGANPQLEDDTAQTLQLPARTPRRKRVVISQ